MCTIDRPIHSCRNTPASSAASATMQWDQRIDNHDHHSMPSGRGGTAAAVGVSEAEDRVRGHECGERKSEYLRSTPLRPHSTPATLLWLEANYEMAEGVCIPRSTLYTHYVHFCGENGLQPVNAASFGKIIRQQFPLLTTRRLGTRGQSRYHYYGIAIRETSTYYDISYSRKGVNCNSEGRREIARQNCLTQPRYKLSPLLPEFPNLRDVCLPAGVPEERVASFIMMYRTHCHRIFDTIMRASLEEVQNFLIHFWQGMPPHILGILGSNVVVNMVGVCDSILYRTICNVLMPSVLQAVPDNLLHIIRKFALELEVWLHVALEDLPTTLRNVKLSLAHNFSQMLKRQSSLNHLCQAAQMVIHNSDLTSQMLQDLRKVDLQSICRQTMYTMDKAGASLITELITGLYHEFEQLLEGQATIETYTEWLESIVERCVIQPVNRSRSGPSSCLRQVARQFLLVWTGFGTRVIRDMTLHSAPSFGSFHLLHLMFDDYVLHLVDILHSEDRAKEMLRNVNCDSPPEIDTNWESTDTDDMTLGDPSPACPNLHPDYAQLQHSTDDAQDIPEIPHQGPVPGEYPTHPETFPSYQYDSDYRNGYKLSGRNCMYQVYNQHALESQHVMEDDTVSSNAADERSIKYINSTLPSYGTSDCNSGICSQYGGSRRGDHDEIAPADGIYYQDHSVAMHSISTSSYYHNYESDANYHYNRTKLKEGIASVKNQLNASKTCIEELEHNYFRPT